MIEQLKKFGVAEKLIFAPEDLLEKKNIPKVARCLASCVDLVNTFISRIAFVHRYYIKAQPLIYFYPSLFRYNDDSG